MVNPSNLASLAGAAAGAVVGPELSPRTAVQRAAARVATAAAGARAHPRSLLEQILFGGLRATTGGGVVPPGGRTSAVAGYASAAAPAARAATSSAATKSSSSSSSASSLAFLSDPKLSIEEKLMRLLAHLTDKYEKEMQAKMNEIAGKQPTTSASAKKKTGGSGILGKVASAVSGLVGGETLKAVSGFLKLPGVKSMLGKVAGPILAAGASALGFPAAAPLLLKYGSKVVDVVGGVASAASSSSSSGASGTAATAGTSAKSEQTIMLELQQLQEKQQRMFALVSNILKSTHDTRMGAINNMR